MASALNTHASNGSNGSNGSNNNIINIKKSQILFNRDLGINDIVPYKLLNENPKHKLYATENKLIFKNLLQLFSSYPNSIFNFLLNHEQFRNIINLNTISNFVSYKTIKNTIPNKTGKSGKSGKSSKSTEHQHINYLSQEYEMQHTIYKCHSQLRDYNEDTPNPNLENSISTFLKNPTYRFFIGFIKLGTKHDIQIIDKLIKTISGVGGHMNSFIIDKKYNRIVHFEPKGNLSYLSPWCSLDILKYLVNSVKSPDDKLMLSRMNVISTKRIFKTTIMPQYFDIYCQTYSICAMLLYCMNPDYKDPLRLFNTLSQKKIIIFQNYFYSHYIPIINSSFGGYGFYNTAIIDSLSVNDEELIQDIKSISLKMATLSDSNKVSNASNSNNNFTMVNVIGSKNIRANTSKYGISTKTNIKENLANAMATSNTNNTGLQVSTSSTKRRASRASKKVNKNKKHTNNGFELL